MKKVGVAILGLGVVGGGTYKILAEHKEFYKSNHNLDITVEGVLEKNRGRAIALGIDESKIDESIAEICSNPEVDIVVEVMGGVEPAKSFVLAALNAGKSVVTSNKELYCKYSHELEKAAKKNHCGLFYEASCVGGVPIIRALTDNLQGNRILSMLGIINGTTNYILTKMSEHRTARCLTRQSGWAMPRQTPRQTWTGTMRLISFPFCQALRSIPRCHIPKFTARAFRKFPRSI